MAAIRGHVAALAGTDWWKTVDADLLDAVRAVEAAARLIYGVQVRLAAEADERGLAGTVGARSTAQLLNRTINVTVGEARNRLAAASVSLPRESLSGATVEPDAPTVIAAVDAGELSAGQCRVITRFLGRAPRGVDAATIDLCVDALLAEATTRDENGLHQVTEQILAMIDQDGSLSDPPEERAELVIGARRGDGLTPIRGLLAPLTAEQLRAAVDALSTPQPIDEHTPDPRPAPLRREQALGEILHRHLTAGAGPRDGGVRPQVIVTIRHDDLFPVGWRSGPAGPGVAPGSFVRGCAIVDDSRDGPRPGAGPGGGSAWSDYSGVQSISLARTLACDAAIIPQVLGTDSVVLDQGRAVRLFTAAQRRAIATRDKGCAFPGCDIPPAWTDAHHIVWWSNGGTTDVSNGILLCRRHHTVIHHGRWRIDTDPTGGRPWFIPPRHIDPHQTPRRNTHFHLPEVILRT